MRQAPANGQQLIVGCLTASTAIAAGSYLASGDRPPFRLVLGAAFTGIGLATIAMFTPELAGGFATLILTGTVFYFGGPLLNAITLRTAPPSKSTKPGAATTGTEQKGSVAV